MRRRLIGPRERALNRECFFDTAPIFHYLVGAFRCVSCVWRNWKARFFRHLQCVFHGFYPVSIAPAKWNAHLRSTPPNRQCLIPSGAFSFLLGSICTPRWSTCIAGYAIQLRIEPNPALSTVHSDECTSRALGIVFVITTVMVLLPRMFVRIARAFVFPFLRFRLSSPCLHHNLASTNDDSVRDED